MDKNYIGKKVLLIGGINITSDLITLAHRNGIFIGVADYNKNTYVKSIADVAYDIDIKNVDAMVELIKKEKYDGIISNFADSIMMYVSEIADKLGMAVPYNKNQLLMSTDKQYFKDKCIEYGIVVPKEYKYDKQEDINNINFPVIVKPIDSSGSRGISICSIKEEFYSAYDKSLEFSKSGKVIIEDYIEGEEINITYIINKGNIKLAAIHDRYFNESQNCSVKVPDIYIYPSKYTSLFVEKYNDKVIEMLKGIGLDNGSLFMQACIKDDLIYIYEAGMRLNGCKTYQILEVENNYNTFENLMKYSITGDMGKQVEFSPKFTKWYATFNILGKPGSEVEKYIGLEEIKSYPWVINVTKQYYEGERIPNTAVGTLQQIVMRLHIYADTKEVLLERIQIIYELVDIKNKEDKSILLAPHSLDDLNKHINYNL